MRGPLAGLMQQAQKMQDNIKKAQEELGAIEVSGQAGGGMVKVQMTARMEGLAGAHGQGHGRHAAAARHEAAVLSLNFGLHARWPCLNS